MKLKANAHLAFKREAVIGKRVALKVILGSNQ